MGKKKLGIIGHARHGKDTVGALLSAYTGLDFKSSSLWCAEKFIYQKVAPLYGYASVEQCYKDRHNHREEWFNLISEYNKTDLARMTREILKEYDIYVGCRNFEELYAARFENLYTYIFWVDASKRLPLENKSSMNLTPNDADYIIDNNGTVADLHKELEQLIETLNIK